MATRTRKPTTVDEYLAGVNDDQRAALESLRKVIRAAAPKAEECISYGIPAYRLNGMLVGFGASKKHCSLFMFNGSTVDAFKEKLKDYDISKGTIRFTVDRPIPSTLVRKLVKARIVENTGS